MLFSTLPLILLRKICLLQFMKVVRIFCDQIPLGCIWMEGFGFKGEFVEGSSNNLKLELFDIYPNDSKNN